MLAQRLAGLGAAILTIAVLLLVGITDSTPVASLRASGFDALQRHWPRVSPPQPVVIVDIDEASLKSVGQWPWPRDTLAALVDRLRAAGASAIAFDILFPEPDRLSPAALVKTPAMAAVIHSAENADVPDFDHLFAQAIAKAPVVLAAATVSNQAAADLVPAKAGFASTGLSAIDAPLRFEAVTSNLPALNAAASGVGLINIDLAASSGVTRSLPLIWSDGKVYRPSLALEALRVALNEKSIIVNGSNTLTNAVESVRVGGLEIPTAENGAIELYFRPDLRNLYISAHDVLAETNDDALKSELSGKIVLIGTSATGLLDMRVSPLGETIPGVSVHAQAIEQVLSGQFLTRPQWVKSAELVFVLIAGLGFWLLGLWARPLLLLASLALVVGLILAVTTQAFRNGGLMVDATFPVLSSILMFGETLAFKLFVSDRRGREMRQAFSRFVAPSVLSEIEKDPAALRLGGQQREVTVMFADIKNFTPLTEKLAPEDLVRVVNRVLTICTHAILAEKGTLDKYIGDAVMAFWNAPIALPAHQLHAAQAALKIQAALAAFNADDPCADVLRQSGLWPLGMRIGLASGPATVGNLGSEERFDYSVLGETVNAAARAEAACKVVGADIVIAGTIAKETESLNLRDVGRLQLKGVSDLVQCHAL